MLNDSETVSSRFFGTKNLLQHLFNYHKLHNREMLNDSDNGVQSIFWYKKFTSTSPAVERT